MKTVKKSLSSIATVLFTLLALLCIQPFAAAEAADATTTSSSTSSGGGAASVDTGDAIGDTLCKIVNKMTGRIGKQIANIAIIFLAISLFMGKTNWGQAVAVGVGIAGIFGASQIVNWLAGTPIDCGTDIRGAVPSQQNCIVPADTACLKDGKKVTITIGNEF